MLPADPTDARVHACPMYHQGNLRSNGIKAFWSACQDTARQGQAVLIHCNNTFHRGPLLLLAIMMLAGYTKDVALAKIAQRRCIYLGHTVPLWEGAPDSKHGTPRGPHGQEKKLSRANNRSSQIS